MKLAYLGPEGSLTEEAALQIRAKLGTSAELLPIPGLARLMESLDMGSVDGAVTPAENSIEGSVNATWDWLVFRSKAQISGELILPVNHCLVGHRAQKIGQIKTILSHPQALAQCRDYLRRNLPDAKEYETVSTSEAARIVSVNRLPIAAIATAKAAKVYGLDVLAQDIQDVTENMTRFILLETAPAHQDSRHYKTSIVCGVQKDHPGGLRDILQVFAQRQINLTRIESRPARKALGDYIFLIDLEGRIADPVVSQALEELKKEGALLKNLGSYPLL